MRARLGVVKGDEAWSVTLIWQQNGDQFQMQLIAPLGQGTTTLKGTAAFVQAYYPDGQSALYQNPEQVFTEALGVAVPIDSLRYWVLGRVDQRSPAKVVKNSQGRLEEIIQDGWEVSYLRYSEQGLPSKIVAENGSIEVKLIIKDWFE